MSFRNWGVAFWCLGLAEGEAGGHGQEEGVADHVGDGYETG